MLAAATPVGVIATDDVAAIVAGDAVPFIQRHVWRVRVVVVQNGLDQIEKVADSTRCQCSVYCRARIAGAEALIADVRMCYAFVTGRRMRVQGKDAICGASPCSIQAWNMQLNLELAEINTVQFNRFGSSRQQLTILVVLQIAELRVCLDEFLIDILE